MPNTKNKYKRPTHRQPAETQVPRGPDAKYKEQSVRIKEVEETVSEILDGTESLTPVTCPDPPSLRPIQAVDNSTVYLIIDSIIKNLTLEKEEKNKLSQKQRAEHSPATRRNAVP